MGKQISGASYFTIFPESPFTLFLLNVTLVPLFCHDVTFILDIVEFNLLKFCFDILNLCLQKILVCSFLCIWYVFVWWWWPQNELVGKYVLIFNFLVNSYCCISFISLFLLCSFLTFSNGDLFVLFWLFFLSFFFFFFIEPKCLCCVFHYYLLLSMGKSSQISDILWTLC